MHLHLLHLAESKPLIDVFNEVVSQHASHFDSVDVTATDPSQPLICSEPTSYTLTVLPEECISVLNSVYSILHPDIWMPSVLPATVKKFSSIQVNGYKLSSMSEKKEVMSHTSWHLLRFHFLAVIFKQFVQLKSGILSSIPSHFQNTQNTVFPMYLLLFCGHRFTRSNIVWENLFKFGVKVFLNIV